MFKKIRQFVFNFKIKKNKQRIKTLGEKLYDYTGIKLVIFDVPTAVQAGKSPILVYPIYLKTDNTIKKDTFNQIYTYITIDRLAK